MYVAHYAPSGAVVHRIVSQHPVTAVGIYRSITGQWFLRGADGAEPGGVGGALRDVAVPADYDGHGEMECECVSLDHRRVVHPAVHGRRPHVPSLGRPLFADVPVSADYDGDHRADVAVYRRETGEWLIRRSMDGGLTLLAGAPPRTATSQRPATTTPTVGPNRGVSAIRRRVVYPAVIRWDAPSRRPGGQPALGDAPVPEDYDGDGRTDVAVYRTTTGHWLIQPSTNLGLVVIPWGAPVLSDLPVPARYDGDAAADIAVYSPATGESHPPLGGWSAQASCCGAPPPSATPLPRPAALR